VKFNPNLSKKEKYIYLQFNKEDISKGTLSRWIRENKADPEYSFLGKGHLKAKDEEIRRLRLELKRTQEERDIIKKALAYFAEDQK
jgi:transposase